MNLNEVEKLLKVAIKKAETMDVKITTVFVDPGGHLKMLIRMDGACFGDVDIAIGKAYTAAAWQANSGDFYEDCLPSGDFFGMHFTNYQKVITFTGGMPVYERNELIGAIGVSGGTKEQDQEILNEVILMLSQIV